MREAPSLAVRVVGGLLDGECLSLVWPHPVPPLLLWLAPAEGDMPERAASHSTPFGDVWSYLEPAEVAIHELDVSWVPYAVRNPVFDGPVEWRYAVDVAMNDWHRTIQAKMKSRSAVRGM